MSSRAPSIGSRQPSIRMHNASPGSTTRQKPVPAPRSGPRRCAPDSIGPRESVRRDFGRSHGVRYALPERRCTMNRFAIALLLAAGAACTQFAGAQSDAQVPKSRREAASAWSEAGLEKIKVKGLDVVYARPGATLAGYRKVMLAPISVAFQRNWEEQPVPGSRIPISAKDSQRIREQLSAL